MSRTGKPDAGAITFEQLISLNDEMAALVRAGIPLEQGLAELGRDLPGRASKLAEVLAQRMSDGENLPQILASQPELFPPIWRAVVESGLRSGRLAVALEAMSATARRMNELRKMVGAALLYPLIVLALAYALFVFLVTSVAPVMAQIYADLTGSEEPLLGGLAWLGETAVWWAGWLPLGMAAIVGFWWHRSRRAAWSDVQTARGRSARRWLIPRLSLGRVVRNERMAAFAEILSLLVGQQVPLPQAVVLAAEASGDGAIAHAAREIAERLQRGEPPARREDLPAGIPPLLGWLLVSGGQQAELGEALSRAAATYHERAARAAAWTAVYLPILLTAVIGGTATLFVALVTFVPIWKLLFDLGQPI